jgi:hypothetical protein
MRDKTRAHKPNLELGLETITHRKNLININKVVEEVEIKLESCLNVDLLLVHC